MSSAEEKKKCVLFSAIGDSDPIRGGFDGPMLHIVRRYRPESVYLFLTADMSQRDKNTNCYEEAIHHLRKDCAVKKYHTDIIDANNFDAFYKRFDRCINEIYEENPDATILLNVSSGTPQIKSTMCLEFASHSQPLTLVQVSSPEKKTGKDIRYFNANNCTLEELKAALDDSYDNLDEAENRCSKPKMLSFKKNVVKNQIKALIADYDYRAAYRLVSEPENAALFSNKVLLYLKHAHLRILPNYTNARKTAKNLGAVQELYPLPYPSYDSPLYGDFTRKYEYYLNMKVKSLRGEISDFLLRLKPFSEALAEKYLHDNIDLETMAKRYDDEWYIDKEIAEKNHSGLMQHLDSFYRHGFFTNQSIGNFSTLLRIMEFCKKLDETIVSSFRDLFPFMQLRNKVAHNLESATENDLGKVCSETTSKQLCEVLEKLLRNIYKDIPEDDDFFNKYEQINQRIIEEMDRPLEIAKSEGD